ncbi:MAG: hypothetical protein IKS62_00555 [Aeriscardovia sp.]|nr:hypothetical protein [Aeriscardovia sp.]MBR6434094.1 hypothetical protein [Aeriscardovia sp.]
MTVPHIDNVDAFLWCAVVLVVLALIAIVVACLRPRRRQGRAPKQWRHSVTHSASQWDADIEKIRSSYQAGDITETEAYANLAGIARSFASERLGTDLTSNTLLDLNRRHQVSNKEHFDAFKQTIAALYPPEFADASRNRAAGEANVDAAADWVESLIGRWIA